MIIFSPIVPRFIFVALNAESSPNLLHVKSRIVVKCSRAEVHKTGPHADIRAGRKQGIFRVARNVEIFTTLWGILKKILEKQIYEIRKKVISC